MEGGVGGSPSEDRELATNERLREYVQERLCGHVRRPDGMAMTGPKAAPWKGRGKSHRQDRRWATAWSPEQISNRLKIDFPDDESMRISHEAIYQALYVQGRGALRRELTACLRSGRALRVPRARVHGRGKSFVTDQIMISERPSEAEDRAIPGHWEGDLILGADRTAIGTVVERSTRFTMPLHLPSMPGHGGPRVKHGPLLASRGAEAVRDAITSRSRRCPSSYAARSLWDQGAEMSYSSSVDQTAAPAPARRPRERHLPCTQRDIRGGFNHSPSWALSQKLRDAGISPSMGGRLGIR
jgi:hypothetical protein